MENRKEISSNKRGVGGFLRPVRRFLDDVADGAERLISGVQEAIGGRCLSSAVPEENTPAFAFWRSSFELSWDDIAAYSGLKRLTKNPPAIAFEAPSTSNNSPPASKSASLSESSFVSTRTALHSPVKKKFVEHLSEDQLLPFLLSGEVLTPADVRELIEVVGEKEEVEVAKGLAEMAARYDGDRPHIFDLLLRVLCNSDNKAVRKFAFFQIAPLADVRSKTGRDIRGLVELMCGYLRRIHQFHSVDYLKKPPQLEDPHCIEDFGPIEVAEYLVVEEILQQSLRMMRESAITPQLRQQMALNFGELIPLIEKGSLKLSKNVFRGFLAGCIPLFTSADLEQPNVVKYLFYGFLCFSTRRDVQKLTAEGLGELFAFVVGEQMEAIVQTHKFDRSIEWTAQLRSKMMPAGGNWRNFQRWGFFIVRVFEKMGDRCPLAVLFALFGEDLWALGESKIPNLRQLFSQSLAHLDLAYAQSLCCVLPDRFVHRLAHLAVHDPDQEVRLCSLEALRKSGRMYTGDMDNDEFSFFIQHTLLEGGMLNAGYEPPAELVCFGEPWIEMPGWMEEEPTEADRSDRMENEVHESEV